MSHLSLVGVSVDGRRLHLLNDQGDEFSLDITPGLRAALRGQTTRLGQLEIPMTSTLRPRDIQDRIRGGESPEEVAEAAGSTVDAIMPFAGPVLAEREHITQRAQKSSVRRSSGDGASGGQSRVLGDAVISHLQSCDARPEQVSWDAYRREDGRWVLTGDFDFADRGGSAKFVYDTPGNYVLADNEDAHWLIGDRRDAASPAASDDLTEVRQRRLTAVSDGSEELPLGDDALDLVHGEPDTGEPEVLSAPPAERPTDAETTSEIPEAGEEPAAKEPPRRTAKKRGRASVPTWDEIMFGGPNEGGRA